MLRFIWGTVQTTYTKEEWPSYETVLYNKSMGVNYNHLNNYSSY